MDDTDARGRVVRLEPLAPRHADDLWEASRDPRSGAGCRSCSRRRATSGTAWMEAALERTTPASSAPSRPSRRRRDGRSDRRATSHSGRSTGALEIGWTWLAPSAWGTGANAEAKLLQLEYAFETLGCRRVEFKTDALNERARPALAALPAAVRGDPPQAHARPRRREAATRPGTASSTTSGRPCGRLSGNASADPKRCSSANLGVRFDRAPARLTPRSRPADGYSAPKPGIRPGTGAGHA